MYQVPLEMICRHDRTAEVCRAAVEEDGWQLENVPEELKTPELCRKALETEAGFGNDFHRGLVQHIPSPEVCMEVLKECRENNPEELYGVLSDGYCAAVIAAELLKHKSLCGSGIKALFDLASEMLICFGKSKHRRQQTAHEQYKYRQHKNHIYAAFIRF